jgi:hypothetical protein
MTRSALKPFQAMPFVAAGGIGRFAYSEAQVALLCASHSGEPRHVAAVADMLAKAGNSERDLQCGAHAPRFHELRGEVDPPPPYSPLRTIARATQGCSRIASCGLPKELPRLRPPLHVDAGIGEPYGIDGCPAPNRGPAEAAPIRRLPHATPTPCTVGAAGPADAMTAHPKWCRRGAQRLELAGGAATAAKIGAEGAGIGSGGGIGIAIVDGTKRALRPLVASPENWAWSTRMPPWPATGSLRSSQLPGNATGHSQLLSRQISSVPSAASTQGPVA